MFEPQFTLNFRILNILSSIERLYGKLQAEKLIPSLSLQLSQENQILATHYSTSIEGNPLSPQDVTNVVLGDQIPTTKSEKEIKKALNDLYAWLQEEKELHPLMKAAIFHHQFAYIHPFFDGNGRLGRILTTYFLLLEHYEVSKYFVIDDYYDIDRHLYSDVLHSADSGDKTSWIEYFLEGIASSLQGAIARIDELRRHHLDHIEGEKRVLVTPREEEVLQIVINKKAIKTSDIEKAFLVTRQQAHSLLSSLVSKKLLKKYGSTKMSYYKLREKKK